jgi:hypothetical protein
MCRQLPLENDGLVIADFSDSPVSSDKPDASDESEGASIDGDAWSFQWLTCMCYCHTL